MSGEINFCFGWKGAWVVTYLRDLELERDKLSVFWRDVEHLTSAHSLPFFHHTPGGFKGADGYHIHLSLIHHPSTIVHPSFLGGRRMFPIGTGMCLGDVLQLQRSAALCALKSRKTYNLCISLDPEGQTHSLNHGGGGIFLLRWTSSLVGQCRSQSRNLLPDQFWRWM